MHELIDHPCVQHKLAIIRDVDTGHKKFRELATEITKFVCYEALKNIAVKDITVQTPVAEAVCKKIDTDLVVVPILRAGVGMLEGILELVPTARVGFVGLYRDFFPTVRALKKSCRRKPRVAPASLLIRCWRRVDRPTPPSIFSRKVVLAR